MNGQQGNRKYWARLSILVIIVLLGYVAFWSFHRTRGSRPGVDFAILLAENRDSPVFTTSILGDVVLFTDGTVEVEIPPDQSSKMEGATKGAVGKSVVVRLCGIESGSCTLLTPLTRRVAFKMASYEDLAKLKYSLKDHGVDANLLPPAGSPDAKGMEKFLAPFNKK